MNSRRWLLIVIAVTAITLFLFLAISARADAVFPQNPDQAADMIGDGPGTRSGNPEEWDTNCGDWCVHLKTGEPTKIHLDDCAWAKIYTEGQNLEVWGPWADMVEEASVYRDWSCEAGQDPEPEPEPEPTPLPAVPVGPPLTEWPETNSDAAWAFSPQGMQTIVESEVTSCNNNAGDCWRLKFSEVRPVSVPKGTLGQIGENLFVTETGLWVQEITMWADWPDIPPETEPEPNPDPDPVVEQGPPPEVPLNPPLELFPSTAEEARQKFTPQGYPLLPLEAFSPCDGWTPGTPGGCWSASFTELTAVSLGKGAFGQVGTDPFEWRGPASGWVMNISIRPDWDYLPSDPDPEPEEPDVNSQVYLPVMFGITIPQNPPLTRAPESIQELVEAICVSGQPACEPTRWNACDEPYCWFTEDGLDSWLSIPQGLVAFIWNGESLTVPGPATEFAGQITIRVDWENLPDD